MRRTRIVRIAGAALSVFGLATRPAYAQAVERAPEPGERFFAKLRQLTFGGENAEAYFSADGSRLTLQRHEGEGACDQQYIMNIDGTGLRRVSNGLGRTTCGYFFANDARIFYASTFGASPQCPTPPDFSTWDTWPSSCCSKVRR